ncbi:hypothetical protein EBQ90_12075 [bacterium]|nr:hypothetical protein [bacterium]
MNDQPAAEWSLNSVVYEYQVGLTDQTPNPNCNNDHDGDGLCEGQDANDSNSRIGLGPIYVNIPTPTFSKVEANPLAGTITFEGTDLTSQGGFYGYYTYGWWWYRYYWECYEVTSTRIVCPYTFDGSYSGRFMTWNNSFDFNLEIRGCSDPAASNYTPGANVNDGSCDYTPILVAHWKVMALNTMSLVLPMVGVLKLTNTS